MENNNVTLNQFLSEKNEEIQNFKKSVEEKKETANVSNELLNETTHETVTDENNPKEVHSDTEYFEEDTIDDSIFERKETVTNNTNIEDSNEEQFKEALKSITIPLIDISNFKITDNKVERLDHVINSDGVNLTVSHIINDKEYKITPYKGIDVKKITSTIYNDRLADSEKYLTVLRDFYDHIDNKKDDSTFESWLKELNINDTDDIYGAIYRSMIMDEDTLPVECDSCKSNSIVVMDKKFEDLYMKFNTEKDKEDYFEIFKSNKSIGDQDIKLAPLNTQFVVGIKLPSLYEDLLLREKIRERYKSIEKYELALTYAMFIDSIYRIDHENQTLVRISLCNSSKVKNNNTVEDDTIKFNLKIQNIYKFIKSLNVKEIDALDIIIAERSKELDRKYKYITPKCICPVCGETIDEYEVNSPLELVLLKNSLVRTLY